METANGKEILDTIARRAAERWGKRWIAELVKAYVKIAIANGDEKATTVNRRPQIERALESGNCTLKTLIWLAAAVGCRFQLHCITVDVEEF